MFSAYVEGTEESLGEALSTCLNVYNSGTYQKLDIVFFSEAIRHAARLSRVLVSYLNKNYVAILAHLAMLAFETTKCPSIVC